MLAKCSVPGRFLTRRYNIRRPFSRTAQIRLVLICRDCVLDSVFWLPKVGNVWLICRSESSNVIGLPSSYVKFTFFVSYGDPCPSANGAFSVIPCGSEIQPAVFSLVRSCSKSEIGRSRMLSSNLGDDLIATTPNPNCRIHGICSRCDACTNFRCPLKVQAMLVSLVSFVFDATLLHAQRPIYSFEKRVHLSYIDPYFHCPGPKHGEA